MPLATISPAAVAAPEEGVSAERDHALRREAAARMATSLVRFAAARQRRAPNTTDLVVVDRIATHEASYRLRGELLAPASSTPVVLVAIEREPDTYPSYRELRAAFGLTRAEARVAAMLAGRKTNNEIARELGVTGATARRHTEHVMLKMGVARRFAVRRAMIECMARGSARGGGGIHSERRPDADDVSGASRGAHTTALALPGADDAGESDGKPRRGRPKKRIVQRRRPKESIVVLLEHEHQRRVVRDALAGQVEVHFAEGPRDVHPPWRHEVPIAVLVELHAERERRMERALGILRREAPDIPRWAYTELELRSINVVVRLVALGLVADVITTAEDLGSRLRALLKNARAWSESEALRRAWDEWVGPETRVIVEACIDASVGAATPRDVEWQLDRTIRSLNRELSSDGLPPLAHIVAFCRMLRAMYRLDHRNIKVKAIASELGYRYTYSLSHQVHRFTGLWISSLPAGRRFATLAALVRAELSATRRQVRGRGRPRASEEETSTTEASARPGVGPPKPPGSI
jgi:DNA-binding CsgD family transcriptional regulator